MRIEPDGSVVLSRRNLLTLLAKLDGFPEDSALTIIGGSFAKGLVVKAEEDEEHYGVRPVGPGVMHPDTEERLNWGGS